MSDILIKGMEMPTSCGQCRFFAWKRGVGQHCAVDDRITFHATIDGLDVGYERNGVCPLVPVPPHGRLIDADVAEVISFNEEEADGKDFMDGILHAADWISKQPTIIPAEEEQKAKKGKSTSDWCRECQHIGCHDCVTAVLGDDEVDEPTHFQRISNASCALEKEEQR